MATQVNQLHRYTELSRGYKVALGLDQVGAGVERVSESLYPMMNIFDHRAHPEWAFPRSEHLVVRYISLLPLAGQRCKAEFYNPADSKALFVADRAYVSLTAAGRVQWNILIGAATLALLGGMYNRDLRWGTTTARTEVRGETSVGAAGGTGIGFRETSTTDSMELDLGVVLPPGCGVLFQPTADNVGMGITVFGRERVMVPGEHGL